MQTPEPLVPASLWRLAARQWLRDFRAGELRLLMLAVTLAVAALCAVGFFADRLSHGLTRDARQKERKKYGQRGARARFQFSKR